MAVGCLSASKTPELPGIETFHGDWYHTGHWPHEGVDFTGQRVGVIGTGSSAIQSIPIFAEQAAHLTVFQRTPNYSLPAKNAPLDPEEWEALKARYPEHREEARTSGFGVPCDLPEKSALEVGDDEREETYRQGFEQGNLVGMLLAYNDLIVDKAANDTAAEYVRKRIREIVDDPEVAETLAPKDYPIGTKRLCLDTDYYATYNRPNVELIDLRKTPLIEVTERGVRTSEREFEFDSIVFATGFDAMTGSLVAFDIKGRDGVLLKEKWAAGPRTYLGVATAGFPNLWMITGPGQPVGAEQHDGLHRAARRLDRRCDGLRARARRPGRSTRPRPPRTSGPSTSPRSATRRCSRWRTPGTWAPTCPASRGCSCPTSAASASTASTATRSPPTATPAST